ncbi:hypothetical protein AB0B10_26020 [Micromonospora arborensis]|uniref:hypothetical protein n=1 Tax=Micromonospora arborensis TaxID=2116518 RepID=UPI003407C4CE
MAASTNRARCTCGHCARCTKILRASLRRESAAPAERTGIGPVARPQILDLLAAGTAGKRAIPAATRATLASATDPITPGFTVGATPDTQEKRAAA